MTMLTLRINCVESGDGESRDFTFLRGSEPTLFTDKMVSGNSATKKICSVLTISHLTVYVSPSPSDQNECYSLRCDVNAQCLHHAGSLTCLCLEGFTGDGQLCVGEYFSSSVLWTRLRRMMLVLYISWRKLKGLLLPQRLFYLTFCCSGLNCRLWEWRRIEI